MRLENTFTGSSPLQSREYIKEINTVVERSREIMNTGEKQALYSDRKVKKDELEKIVDNMNDFVDPLQTNVRFQLHEELNEYYVVVVDPVTDEVVKEIPPKKMLDMYAAMAEFMGILIDEKI